MCQKYTLPGAAGYHPLQTTSSPPLAAGKQKSRCTDMADEWTQVTGEAGRVYYLNHATGETSWLKPAAAKLTEEPLPDGWVEKKARAGNKYYFNPVTGETSYDRPTRDAAQMAVEKAAAEQRVKEQEVGASQLEAAAQDAALRCACRWPVPVLAMRGLTREHSLERAPFAGLCQQRRKWC